MGKTVIAALLALCLVSLCPAQAPALEREVETRPPRSAAATRAGMISLSAPQEITAPGYYRVVRNVSGDGIIFDVRSSHVTLDLGGFLVESSSADQPAIRVLPATSADLEDVTIENGKLRGGNQCLFVDRTARFAARGLNVGGCDGGMRIEDATNGAIVEDNHVGRWGDEAVGIDIGDCWNCRVRDNVIHGGTTLGLGVQNAVGGEVTGNRVMFARVGFQIGGNGVVVRDNVSTGCTRGVELQTRDSLIESFLITAAGTGLHFMVQATDNIYRDNIARNVNNESFIDEGSGNLSAGGNHLPDPD